VTRKDLSLLWYLVARNQIAAGDKEAAKISRRQARHFGGKR